MKFGSSGSLLFSTADGRYTMMHGDFTNLSERKLMECLNRLGYDIEIKVRPAAEPIGHLTLATV